MNKFVSLMKKDIQDFYKAAFEANAEKEKNNSTYLSNIASEANAKLDSDIQNKYVKAIANLDIILNDAKADTEKWAVLDGKKIDTADLELLRGGFNLGYKELSELIDKHAGNATMLNAIGEYADTHKIVVMMPTVKSKGDAYVKLALSANDMLSTILSAYNDPQFMSNLSKGGMLEAGVNSWGDNLSIEVSKALAE